MTLEEIAELSIGDQVIVTTHTVSPKVLIIEDIKVDWDGTVVINGMPFEPEEVS